MSFNLGREPKPNEAGGNLPVDFNGHWIIRAIIGDAFLLYYEDPLDQDPAQRESSKLQPLF